MRITDIRPQEDIPRLLEDIAQARLGLQYSGYWRHTLKDGRLIDVEVTSHTLLFRGRQSELVVIRDVTKEKEAEEALKQAEKKYRSIFEEAIVGIFQSTPDGRLVSANPAMAQLYGYDSAEEMLTTITNDAWFGPTSAPYQHFEQASMRAIEEGRYLVRSANTGISGIVDPYGRVLQRSRIFERTVMSGEVRMLDAVTIYGRIGDACAYACAALTLAALLAGLSTRTRTH